MHDSNQYILALETSSSICDVALLCVEQGQARLYSSSHDATGEHAERLLPMVDGLLVQAGIGKDQLSAVAFGQGPGGFTGLRVACGVAQGLGFALGAPVVPVVSLRAAALQDEGDEPVRIVAQDARMGEIYVAAYAVVRDDQGEIDCIALDSPALLDERDIGAWILSQAPGWLPEAPRALRVRVLGDALDACPGLRLSLDTMDTTQVEVRVGAAARATAACIATLARRALARGDVVEPRDAAPLYVRDKVAYTTQERTQGLGGNPRAQAPVLIRRMSEQDVDDVVRIEALVQAFPWTKGNFRDALQAGYQGWVATRNGVIQGFYLLMFAPDVAHLLLIAVQPDAQRNGLGHKLLRHSEAEAMTRGLPALILEVRPSNHQAVAFYQNRGFRQLGVRKDYYPNEGGAREDAWVMKKEFDAVGASHD